MTHDVRTARRDLDLLELSEMFERDDFNSYPVEDDGQVVGIVTKFDILKCFAFTPSQMLPRYHDLMGRKVGDVMTPEFIYVSPDTRLTRVLQIMVEHRIRSIIVLDMPRSWSESSPARTSSRRSRRRRETDFFPFSPCGRRWREAPDERHFFPCV